MEINDSSSQIRFIKKNILRIFTLGMLFLLAIPSFAAAKPTEDEITDRYIF